MVKIYLKDNYIFTEHKYFMDSTILHQSHFSVVNRFVFYTNEHWLNGVMTGRGKNHSKGRYS